jgi:hypothetical protein
LLSDEQKDYLNYKRGFSKEKDDQGNRKELKPEIRSLYSNLSESNFKILDEGFKYPHFKDNFPNLFVSSPHVNNFTLKTRANSDELQLILEKIKMIT